MKYYYDGGFRDESEPCYSHDDHGMLYGDGVYEGIRVYDGVIHRLAEHLSRLRRSAFAIGLSVPEDSTTTDGIISLLRENSLTSAYVRIVCTRGSGEIGPNPETCDQSHMMIMAKPISGLHGGTPDLRMSIASTRRPSIDSLSHEIKTLNYLDSVQAVREARSRGAHDAVILDDQGCVAEASVSNIFIARNDGLMTPSLDAPILGGITRHTVIDIARSMGIDVVEGKITPYMLKTADCAFLTGTHAEVVKVSRIDEVEFPSRSEIFDSISMAYRQQARRQEFGVRIN